MAIFIIMKTKLSIIFFLAAFLLAGSPSFSQDNEEFKQIDDYVKSLGSLDTLNVGTISSLLTKKFADNRDKARAIFDWIAFNISFDPKLARVSGNEKINSDEVLKKRKTNAAGYAALFQDMCSVAKIRCLTVDGYVRQDVEAIGEKPDEFNHTWAVVQLGQSPDSWYYVDPTWGAGYTDARMTSFTKQYNDGYFFADKGTFNLQHQPDNSAWLLGPKTAKDFFSLPILYGYAYTLGTNNFSPVTGKIKIKASQNFAFSFKVSKGVTVDSVALAIGPEKKKKLKDVYFSYNNNVVSFTHKFEEEDSYPITILVNNKPLLSYMAEITE